jgi:BTB/POZ domain
MSLECMSNVVFETGFPLHRCCVQWKIRYFSAHLADEKLVLISPEFSTNSGHIWKLQISNPCYRETQCSITLVSKKCETNIRTEVSLIIKEQKYETQRRTFRQLSTIWETTLWKIKREDLQYTMQYLTENDVFWIELQIEEWTKETITVTNSSCTETAVRHPIDSKMTKLWTDQAFTDVTLECQGEKFLGHKLVLATVSPVFEAMFKEGTKENQDNYVNIEDMDSDVFEAFLRYLYTGQVDKLDGIFMDLFAAADKYDVAPLREICIRHMATNISVDNAIDVLTLAERHTIEPTKSVAM